MNNIITEVQGFDVLKRKIKQLPDKAKKREVVKILRRSARPTVQAARTEAPKSARPHFLKGGKLIEPGNLRKSIRVAVLRKSRVPMLVVGPRSSGKYDGFYGRQFVIPGHKTTGGGRVPADPFMDRARKKSAGPASAKALAGMEKYVQKLIDKL